MSNSKSDVRSKTNHMISETIPCHHWIKECPNQSISQNTAFEIPHWILNGSIIALTDTFSQIYSLGLDVANCMLSLNLQKYTPDSYCLLTPISACNMIGPNILFF